MRHWWWKVLCVLLLVYTAVVGLRTPLGASIVWASFKDSQTLEIKGYGTEYGVYPTDSVTIALRSNNVNVCAARVDVESNTDLKASFRDGTNPGSRSDLVVINGTHGELVLNDAFFSKGSFRGDTCDIGMEDPFTHRRFVFPNRSILNETIRNLFFHVPMWFTMIVLMGISFFFSIKHLRTGNLGDDLAASIAVNVSLLFGILGITTGSIWARATWGGWWTYDTKLNGSALTLLMYFAYVVLRGSVPDAHKRGRLAAVYNIFAFMLMLVFIMVLPRLTDSLHPGNGGNPAFSQYDLDSALKSVFYPACLGWILLGIWAFNLRLRHGRLTALLDENET